MALSDLALEEMTMPKNMRMSNQEEVIPGGAPGRAIEALTQLHGFSRKRKKTGRNSQNRIVKKPRTFRSTETRSGG